MEIKTTEFFKNIKRLPPPGSEEFHQLIKWEEEKIMGGITINGVKISPWLYWHLNHWWIRIDEVDNYGNDVRVESNPILRDNEWERAEHLENCRLQRAGYIEIGARQGGKSEMEASYFSMNATMFKDTQNVIVCGNDNDLSLLKDKVDFGIGRIWEGIKIPRLDKTWRTNQVRLGYKLPNGDDAIWSSIVIRNAKDGHNTEVAAGTTAKSFIMDEVGKYAFASVYKAAEPAFKGSHGMRAVPILVGTGGAFQNGKDAEGFFLNPRANNFLPKTDPETGKETGLFLSGLYRQDFKQELSLSDWLRSEKGMTIEDDSILSTIKIRAADKEKALKKIIEEREAAKQNQDKTLYLKQVMYFPLTIEECFLSEHENIFNVDAARKRKARLLQHPKDLWNVDLFMEGGKVQWVASKKQPISKFPLGTSDNKDAPIQIYEHPVKDPPYALYIAGVDSYRQGQAKYSKSLGSVYIYKRIHSIAGEGFQDMIVASYSARPDNKEDWENQARLLCKYYNARVVVENDEMSFIEYIKNKGDAHMLVTIDQIPYMKELVPNSTTFSRKYGMSRAAANTRRYLHSSFKKYMEDKVHVEKDENGSVTLELLGLDKILDPMLLEEVIQFNDEDEEGNYDRIVAFELALAYANILEPIIGPADSKPDERYKAYFKPKKQTKQVFNSNIKTFSKRMKTPFKR